jgi:hypothetical protein
MIAECSEIIVKGFSEDIVKALADELNKRKIKTKVELADIMLEFGITVLITLVNDTIRIINLTGKVMSYEVDEY